MHLSSNYEDPYYKSFDQTVAAAVFVSYIGPLILCLLCWNFGMHVPLKPQAILQTGIYINKKFVLTLGKSLSVVMDKTLVLQTC